MFIQTLSNFLTNLDQPLPRGEKFSTHTRNLWCRVGGAMRLNYCCGHEDPRAVEWQNSHPVWVNVSLILSSNELL